MVVKQRTFFSNEVFNIRNFLRKLRTPSHKEFGNLLISNFTALSAIGLAGYSIKFVHMVINKALSN